MASDDLELSMAAGYFFWWKEMELGWSWWLEVLLSWFKKRYKKFLKASNGCVSLITWGCFSFNGVGSLAFDFGKINSEAYIRSLTDYILPIATHLTEERWIYRQDNVLVHTSRNKTLVPDKKYQGFAMDIHMPWSESYRELVSWSSKTRLWKWEIFFFSCRIEIHDCRWMVQNQSSTVSKDNAVHECQNIWGY